MSKSYSWWCGRKKRIKKKIHTALWQLSFTERIKGFLQAAQAKDKEISIEMKDNDKEKNDDVRTDQ